MWLGMPELTPHIMAYYYNANIRRNAGKLDAVFNIKNVPAAVLSTLVRDFEMSQAGAIEPNPWQTDACIGSWHYSRSIFENHRYRTPEAMVHLLVDVVSKNGNLLLNIPLPGHGRPDDDEFAFLDKFGAWMALNSEAIYSTRPWKIAGEGPTQGRRFAVRWPRPAICRGRHAVYDQGRHAVRHRAGLARRQEIGDQVARLGFSSLSRRNRQDRTAGIGIQSRVVAQRGRSHGQLAGKATCDYAYVFKINPLGA